VLDRPLQGVGVATEAHSPGTVITLPPLFCRNPCAIKGLVFTSRLEVCPEGTCTLHLSTSVPYPASPATSPLFEEQVQLAQQGLVAALQYLTHADYLSTEVSPTSDMTESLQGMDMQGEGTPDGKQGDPLKPTLLWVAFYLQRIRSYSHVQLAPGLFVTDDATAFSLDLSQSISQVKALFARFCPEQAFMVKPTELAPKDQRELAVLNTLDRFDLDDFADDDIAALLAEGEAANTHAAPNAV
jgi:hypothetical protein